MMPTILAMTQETESFVCVGIVLVVVIALVLLNLFRWLGMIHDTLIDILGELRRSQPPEPLPDDPEQPDTVSPNITNRAKIDAMFKKFRRK